MAPNHNYNVANVMAFSENFHFRAGREWGVEGRLQTQKA